MSDHPARVPAPQWPVVCATGHRPQHLSTESRSFVREKLAAAVAWLRDECGTQIFISGMALGTDLWWARAVVDAGLALGAYVPFPQQADRWTARDQQEWAALREAADPNLSWMGADSYSKAALHQRNEQMLRDSAAVVCVYLPGKAEGGTFSAIRTAHALSKPGVHIDPTPGQMRVRRGLPDIARR